MYREYIGYMIKILKQVHFFSTRRRGNRTLHLAHENLAFTKLHIDPMTKKRERELAETSTITLVI